MRSVLMLLPSLRISGGVLEAVRLAQEMEASGKVRVVILSFWKAEHAVDTGSLPVVQLLDTAPQASRAWRDLPQLAIRLLRYLRSHRGPAAKPVLLLTHYSTFPFAWLAPGLQRLCFNQDMEWLFVAPGVRRTLLKRLILFTSARSLVVTPNRYITASYRQLGIEPFCEASIWADAQWLTADTHAPRDLDVLMLLRESPIKRLDLYEACIQQLQGTSVRMAVITPDTRIAERLQGKVAEVHLRPTNEAMQVLYARSRSFLLLSDVEGFGLPPLEAMGSGCIPLCRDCGGVRCYMDGPFEQLLLDFNMPTAHVVRTLQERLSENALPTPATARDHFAQGLASSRASRQVCVAALVERLNAQDE